MEKYRYSDEEIRFMEQSTIPFAIYQFINKKVVTLILSNGFLELFGFSGMTKEEIYDLMDNDMYRYTHPDDIKVVGEAAYRFATDGGSYDVIYRTGKNDEYRIIHSYGNHIYKQDGTRLAFVWYRDLGVYSGEGISARENMRAVLSSADRIRGFSDEDQSRELNKISDEYEKLKKENERLRKEADANRKIAELKKSVSDLLTNMPAMTFSKDVDTRKYLACNQAFAEYAHKDTPDDVVGLTDFEIFDPKTAKHFVEDDKKALAMNKPYIFYEDVPDAAGNPRQFQTTKLKFTDDTGRECLLGLCQDVTDAMRIKREYIEKLDLVQNMAEIDALTGIKNRNAYKVREDLMNMRIKEHRQPEFAIIVFDVNDLKFINDTQGHEAGDRCIRDACEIICKTFKRSPVYRIGGDEFVVISQDEDYNRSEYLIGIISRNNEEALSKGGIVIACGMARFSNEESVSEVFEIADKRMYENKHFLKKLKEKDHAEDPGDMIQK